MVVHFELAYFNYVTFWMQILQVTFYPTIYIWTALLDTLQTGIITTKYKLHQLLNYGVLL